MSKEYTKKFLISELHRFVRENSRVPVSLDMQYKFGYPSYHDYERCFDKWNNALEAAKLKINQTKEKRTGEETCCVCGNHKKQDQQWITKNLPKGQVMCVNCYYDIDYVKGNLNPNSTTGKAFISQRIVANVLNLQLKYDCNCSDNFNHSFDLYDKGKYNYINVKDSALHDKVEYNSRWFFTLTQKTMPDTYIMLGFDEDRKNILHVWITDPLDDLTYNEIKERPKGGIGITNTYYSLERARPWEVDAKPYNDMLHSMSLDNCSVLRSDLR